MDHTIFSILTLHYSDQVKTSIPVRVKRSHAVTDHHYENTPAPKQYYACTDRSIGAAIIFDQEKAKNLIKDSKNLQAFSSLDDAEDFIMERNPEILLRRIQNLEEEKNELAKRNESLKNKL